MPFLTPTPALTPLWLGDASTRLDPKCPILEGDKNGARYTMIYNGVYDTMLANIPPRLSNVPGAPAHYYVDTQRLEKGPGGTGKMTITLIPNPIPDFTFAGNSVQEVEFIELQKPLKACPVFNPVTADSVHPNAGLYALTSADLIDIELWQEGTNATQAKAYQYTDSTGATITLSANAKEYAQRILAGQDSYNVYAPVARSTTKNTTQPTGSYCGSQADPPMGLGIDGYVYVQTADRYTHERTWSETREWTGFDTVDDIIYPEDGGT
jgi:hypothetical protein